jgi:stage II sporulation protein M
MPHRLRRRYALGIATLRCARGSIALATALFAAGAATAVVVAQLRPAWILAMLRTVDVASVSSPHYVNRLFALWVHNTVTNYAFLWLGRLRSVVPVLGLVANGALLGGVMALLLKTHSIEEVAIRIVPHGVFELPAMLIAPGLGIWVGASAWSHLAWNPIRKRRDRSNAVYLLFVMPLLAVAAAIEALWVP